MLLLILSFFCVYCIFCSVCMQPPRTHRIFQTNFLNLFLFFVDFNFVITIRWSSRSVGEQSLHNWKAKNKNLVSFFIWTICFTFYHSAPPITWSSQLPMEGRVSEDSAQRKQSWNNPFINRAAHILKWVCGSHKYTHARSHTERMAWH